MPVNYYPNSAGDILQATTDRIATIEGFKLVQLNRILPILPEENDQVPYALIYNDGESMVREGDTNCGSPWFKHKLKMIVDVVMKEQDEKYCFLDSTTVVELIRSRLMCDYTWLAMIEGIEEFSHEIFTSREGNLILIGAKLNIQVTFESNWSPDVTNDLEGVELSIIAKTHSTPVYKEINFHERTRDGNCLPDKD